MEIGLKNIPRESFSSSGNYSFTYFCDNTQDGDGSAFFLGVGGLVGDHCKISNIFITNLGAHVVTDLGFACAGNVRSEFFEATQADYQQVIASRLDKSNLSILFNNPP